MDLETNQVRRKLRQALKLSLRESILDGDVFSFNPAKLAQLLPKRLQEDRDTGSSAIIQVTYAGDFPCLLRAGKRNICQKKSCQQPGSDSLLHVFFLASCLTPFASFHLISLLARASTSGGIITPICLAVLRFITNSNFVGCSTGRSAGLAPLRILST